ncbi:sterol desaturase family protein [Plastoroseomonas hellenica]|uniref:sterol desaturase family protein n=1 Tax=Plastoroseomonas hellenica TaxID=2687306 RepID=UPI001BAB0684
MTEVAAKTGAFLLTLVAMEGVAWAAHRFLMHGPLWRLHASHHTSSRRRLEGNDLFGAAFALLAFGLFWLGARPGWDVIWWAAAGMGAYGLLYAVVHDGMVHRRFPLPARPARGYLRRLAQAHHLHHRTHARDGAVSFGFLMPRDIPTLKRRLRERQAGRA